MPLARSGFKHLGARLDRTKEFQQPLVSVTKERESERGSGCICRAHLLLVSSTLPPNVQVCRSSCTRRNMCCLCDYPSKVFAVLCPRFVSCCHQHPSRSLLMLSGMLHSCGKRSTTAVERVGGLHCRQMYSGARCA